MEWQQGLREAAKRAAKSDVAKKAGKTVGGLAVAAGGKVGGDAVHDWWTDRRERTKRLRSRRAGSLDQRDARDKAVAMALDLRDGRYSERTVIANEYRYVVWVRDEPRAVFPPIDPKTYNGTLPEHPELRDFDPSRLIDPRSPPS